MTQGQLAWGILGTGAIAKNFAKGVAHAKRSRLVAVGSRTKESAEKFGREYGVPEAGRHGSYEALLADPGVQAVYISTPHPMHAEWAIKAAEAGKHVLCEKPIGLNAAEAMAMIDAAEEHGVFLMEAFMYRCHPQTLKLVELIRDKAIGDVKLIDATFGFAAGFNPEGRLFKNALGGGGILDVGCYPVSMSRLVAGVALGLPEMYADPLEVKASGKLGPTGVDHIAYATLKFPGDIYAQIGTAVEFTQENVVRVFGTGGTILVPWPWIPSREGGETNLVVTKHGGQPEEITIQTQEWLYGLEADTVAANVQNRQAAPPAMSWGDTLGNMRTLDRWREAVGVVYDAERWENLAKPIHGRPLTRRGDAPMKYGRIAGLDKDVSRLILGVDNQTHPSHAAAMFDHYFERGGNAFDTAYIYAGGLLEKNLGQWIKSRGVRDKAVVICKGAHTPNCNPADLTKQLHQSLERLGTDHADLYMMHRDNPAIPAGEFVDVLNEHKKAGRVRAFGGSNWSLPRVQEANDYAKRKGLAGFSVVSNNFSLARMVDPVWGGCISASDPASRAWLEKHRVALLGWSSQARGFFLPGKAAPDKQDDAELVRCWYSPDNFARLERANELAKKKGVEPINIALAYVLAQPFPTFPLIGPRTPWETRSSLHALEVELTPDEVKWLNLGE